MYAEKMRVFFTDKEGSKKPVWFGSYGIGPTRVMGALVEVNHDKVGIIWPPQVAPFQVHLIELEKNAQSVYEKLTKAKVEVLYDDRRISAGEKFADADLIGIPVRLTVSKKIGDKIEWKERTKRNAALLTFDKVISKLL